MSDAFATEDISAALNDATNGVAENPGKEEAYPMVRENGWVEAKPYDYNTYNASGKDAAAVLATEGTEWGHGAAKYEWKEEYGDIGPEVPELEEQLFRSEFLNRQGVKFGQ